jgi:hypothetical protein
MPTPKEYRQSADFCMKLAEASNDKIEQAVLIKIAHSFRQLANRKAKRQRAQKAPKNSN